MSNVIIDFFHNTFNENGSGEDAGYSPGVINPATVTNSDYKYKLVAHPSESRKVQDLANNRTYNATSYYDTIGALGSSGRVISTYKYAEHDYWESIGTDYTSSHLDSEFTLSFWVLTSILTSNANAAIVWGGAHFYIVLYTNNIDYPYIINAAEKRFATNPVTYPTYLKNPDYKGVKKNDWNWVALTKKDGIGRLWVNGDFQGKFDYPTYELGTNTGVNPLNGGDAWYSDKSVYFDDYCILNKALYTVDKNIPVPTEYFPWS